MKIKAYTILVIITGILVASIFIFSKEKKKMFLRLKKEQEQLLYLPNG